MSDNRELTEAEIRGMAVMQYAALDYSVAWTATMAMRRSRPTKDEFFSFAGFMVRAREAIIDLSRIPETDGHIYDEYAEELRVMADRLREQL